VLVKVAFSRQRARLEEKRGGSGIALPEERGARGSWMGFGELVAKGSGGRVGACLEQSDDEVLPVGSRMIFDSRSIGYELDIDGAPHAIMSSKALLARVRDGDPDQGLVQALGWWAFVRDLGDELERYLQGARRVWTPSNTGADATSTFYKLALYGGQVVSLGRGCYLGPQVNPRSERTRRTEPMALYRASHVRGWEPDVSVGDKLAFNAQTAVTMRLKGETYYFASAAAEVAGASAAVWG
jgi:co-chaperonin GroES (HSP10)